MTDVLGIANPFYDRHAYVERKFLEQFQLEEGQTTITRDPGEVERSWGALHETASTYFKSLGGGGVNVLKTLAHLGKRVADCGIVGPDEAGKEIETLLNKIGVQCLLSKGKKNTGIVNCFITENERTMQTYLGVCDEFSEKDVDETYFRDVRHVHLEGYLVDFGSALAKSIEFAKKNGSTLSLDLASRTVVERQKSIFEKSVPHVDYLFGNIEEYGALTGSRDPQEIFKRFSVDQTVVMTDSNRGSWVKERGKTEGRHYDALPVSKVVASTGAGDFYGGGFLYGALEGLDVSRCVDIGNLLASCVIQQQGADLPEPKWAELKERVTQMTHPSS